MKTFIITVDTEGDNLWLHKEGKAIETHNAEYLPRFQTLCEKYDFKPVYLTNYEMANCNIFTKEAKVWLEKGKCEIGIHLHAWNNPPHYELQGPYNQNAYLIEFPEDVIREKFRILYDLIEKKFGIKPVSHRAGRWAMNELYFKILKEFAIKVDCSITPGINWSSNKGIAIGGPDYSKEKNQIQTINGILEVPPSIHCCRNALNGSLAHKIRSLILGEFLWLRPAICSLEGMSLAVKKLEEEGTEYLEFMIHSSELMPGGSPYFTTAKEIEAEFSNIERFFKLVKNLGYKGMTLSEYYSSR